MLSSNANFTNDEKDVLIIWVNKSMHNVDRYQIDNLLPALTRAKKAIYFFGCTEVFQVRICLFRDNLGQFEMFFDFLVHFTVHFS